MVVRKWLSPAGLIDRGPSAALPIPVRGEQMIEHISDEHDKRVYAPTEVAKMLRVSVDTIRRLLAHEPGVIVIYIPKKGKRPYRTLRIPQSVLDRLRNK